MWKHRIGTLAIAASLSITALTASPSLETTDADLLLPDLEMLQPDDFRLERKGRGVRLLRFSTAIVNAGNGVFEVYGYEPAGNPITTSSTLAVTQRIQDSAGALHETPTAATMFYAGDGHAHFHVLDLQYWMLAFEATPNDAVASGAKSGFCFWDNVDLFGLPRYYDGLDECHLDSATATVPMGLSVGWGDKYPWNIAFQYIDISRLPLGNYCLSLTADPNGEFVEANTANNTVRTRISIKSNRVTVLAQNCT